MVFVYFPLPFPTVNIEVTHFRKSFTCHYMIKTKDTGNKNKDGVERAKMDNTSMPFGDTPNKL